MIYFLPEKYIHFLCIQILRDAQDDNWVYYSLKK